MTNKIYHLYIPFFEKKKAFKSLQEYLECLKPVISSDDRPLTLEEIDETTTRFEDTNKLGEDYIPNTENNKAIILSFKGPKTDIKKHKEKKHHEVLFKEDRDFYINQMSDKKRDIYNYKLIILAMKLYINNIEELRRSPIIYSIITSIRKKSNQIMTTQKIDLGKIPESELREYIKRYYQAHQSYKDMRDLYLVLKRNHMLKEKATEQEEKTNPSTYYLYLKLKGTNPSEEDFFKDKKLVLTDTIVNIDKFTITCETIKEIILKLKLDPSEFDLEEGYIISNATKRILEKKETKFPYISFPLLRGDLEFFQKQALPDSKQKREYNEELRSKFLSSAFLEKESIAYSIFEKYYQKQLKKIKGKSKMVILLNRIMKKPSYSQARLIYCLIKKEEKRKEEKHRTTGNGDKEFTDALLAIKKRVLNRDKENT